MDKIKHQVEYMPGRILFNGTQLNTPAEDIDPARWTEVDDDAYYLFGVGSKLTIYNLGAFVMDLPPTDMRDWRDCLTSSPRRELCPWWSPQPLRSLQTHQTDHQKTQTCSSAQATGVPE